jgi:septum site-determining protein MinD
MSETYAVASSKGGVGKTTTVANLGTALSAAGGDVVVVDADIGMANLAGALGVEVTGATLHDALAGDATVAEAVHEGPEGLAVVPGSPELEDYRDAKPTGLADIVADLEAQFDTVVLDTGAGLSHDTVLPIGLADEVLLVSTAQRDSLANTDKTRQLVERLDGSVAGLVLTRAPEDADAGPVEAPVVGRVPDDPAVDDALVAGVPVVSYRPHSPAAAAYRDVTEAVFDADVPVPEGEPTGDDADVSTAGDEGGSEVDDAEAGDVDAAEADEGPDAEAERDEADGSDETTDGNDVSGSASTDGDDDDGTDSGREAEADEADGEDDAPEDAAEPRKSVGPVRETDVPISEAEGEGMAEPEPRRAEDAQEAPATEAEGGSTGSDAESGSGASGKSKGFLSRLFGR